MFGVNFAQALLNKLTGFAPKMNILISFEMNRLKLGTFALNITLTFHICTRYTQNETWVYEPSYTTSILFYFL